MAGLVEVSWLSRLVRYWHNLTVFLSLIKSHSFSLSFLSILLRTHTHSVSFLSISHTLSPSRSVSHTYSLSLSLFHSVWLSLSHSFALSLSLSFCLSLSLSPTVEMISPGSLLIVFQFSKSICNNRLFEQEMIFAQENILSLGNFCFVFIMTRFSIEWSGFEFPSVIWILPCHV